MGCNPPQTEPTPISWGQCCDAHRLRRPTQRLGLPAECWRHASRASNGCVSKAYGSTHGQCHEQATPHQLDVLSSQNLPATALLRRQQGWRAALATKRAEVLARTSDYLDSKAGMEGGALLTANAGDMQVDLTDEEFRVYLRMRLGLAVCKHHQCQHRSATKNKTCPQVSDPLGRHALLCKLGGGLTSTHNAICTILLQAARAAGYTALKEQVVAELATADRKEPRVDVDAWGVVAEPRVLLDVTVTCPFAQRYEDKSATISGEARKDKEYPCRAGLAVTGVAVDVYGKHGPAMGDFLMRMADLARQHDLDMGSQPRRWISRWRIRIATELARGCARQVGTANSSTTPRQLSAPQLVCLPTTTAISIHHPPPVRRPPPCSR